MIKAFIHPSVGIEHSLFVELNPKFQLETDSDQADVIFITGENVNLTELSNVVKPHHVLVSMEIFHTDHYMSMKWFYEHIKKCYYSLTNKIIIIHTNKNILDNHNLIYFDHLFDREKLYCTDYDGGIRLNDRVWTKNCTKEMYSLHPIKSKIPFKKFLAPMRVYTYDGTYTKRMAYRVRIKEFLSKKNESFISPANSTACFLPTSATGMIIPYLCGEHGGTWYPTSNVYYENSLISVYTETLVINEHNVTGLTEKTFDPLIQGNFILPFGYFGLIKDILSYGFKLPSWIDYSYDDKLDLEERFTAYLESLSKLSDYPLDQLCRQADNDIEILEHNRSIFYSKPYNYPLLADKIKLCIEHNNATGWQY